MWRLPGPIRTSTLTVASISAPERSGDEVGAIAMASGRVLATHAITPHRLARRSHLGLVA
jgi:hypothetical protein